MFLKIFIFITTRTCMPMGSPSLLILRWSMVQYKNYLFESGFGTGEPNLTDDNYILVQKGSTRTFNPQRDYLWPFPVEELALNENLSQNPGW